MSGALLYDVGATMPFSWFKAWYLPSTAASACGHLRPFSRVPY